MWRKCRGRWINIRSTIVAVTSTSVLPPSIRKVRGKSSFFLFGLDCVVLFLHFHQTTTPLRMCQRICCLIGLYMNVNCICSNTVCSFTDFSCNITLHSGHRITWTAEKNIFPLFFCFCSFFSRPLFCAQLLTGKSFLLSQQFRSGLIQEEIKEDEENRSLFNGSFISSLPKSLNIITS